MAFQQAILDILQACQVLGYIPEQLRHSYIYPIGKSGPRGETLDGARQICLLEVILKLPSLNMSVETSAVWHEWETQSKLQTGFTPHSEPAGTGAVVVSVMADARKNGKTMFMLVADIAKAFQAIPIWGIPRCTHPRDVAKSGLLLAGNGALRPDRQARNGPVHHGLRPLAVVQE